MDWRYDFFEPSVPLVAKGGIRARSKRGAFGRSWWAGRWSAVLEGCDLGARLARGRSYARRGQVLDVSIEKGRARARVQGSRRDPYTVTIKVKLLSPPQWARVATVLAREARFAAKLLASEMPEDIETAFRKASLSLFPERRRDRSRPVLDLQTPRRDAGRAGPLHWGAVRPRVSKEPQRLFPEREGPSLRGRAPHTRDRPILGGRVPSGGSFRRGRGPCFSGRAAP